MTEEERLFRQDIREKSITARSSRKVGSSRRRRCSFSTDHMSQKEWEKMNGPVYTVKLDEPMLWDEFRNLPDSLQEKYVREILAKYAVGPSALGRMFGIHSTACSKYLRSLGIKFSGKASAEETARFQREFCKQPDPENKPAIAADKKNTELERVSLTFSGLFSPEAIAARLAGFFSPEQQVTVSVEITVR